MPTSFFANRYRTIRSLGAGAMGSVWLVEDESTGVEVALKEIKRELANTEKLLLHFKQEFRLMSQLRHPNCCGVYDYGVLEDGSPYFTMEVVPGQGLDEIAPLEPERFRDVIAQLALALGYVHALGFVHRDLKPANVRLQPDGVVKLMDYGLMDYAGRSGSLIAGTIGYLSPEVIQRGPVDGRADLYALGCLAYELVAGRPPFVADRPQEVLRAHVVEPPTPPSRLRAGIPEDVERLIMQLLAKEPTARPQSAAEVLEALGVEPPPGLGGSLLASPMQGRVDQVARLDAALAALAAGRNAGALLFHGPAGVGKSRLIHELRCHAQLAGIPIGAGRSQRQTTPYAPFVSVLRDLLPAIREHAAEVLDRHAPALMRLLPELDVAHAPELDSPSRDKHRLQGAIADVLEALTAHRPAIMVVEDWHWADPLSIELAAHLARTLRERPALLVLTSRRSEDADTEWAHSLEQHGVAPLGHVALGAMLAAMLGSRPDEGFVGEVERLTGGNPFFVEKLLDHHVRAGRLRKENGCWNADAALLADEAPVDVASLLTGRLAALPEVSRTLAQVGGLLGQAFDIDFLKEVAAFEEEELFGALEALREARIVELEGEGRYRFTHDQILEILAADIPADERVFLHGMILHALERRLGGQPLPAAPLGLVAALADHAAAAGDDRASLRYALAAGTRYQALYARAAAGRWLSAGLALARGVPDRGETRLPYLVALGDLERGAGNADAGLALYDEAVAITEALGAADLASLLVSRAKLRQINGQYEEASADCRRAVPVAEATGDDTAAVRALQTESRIRLFTGDKAGSLAYAEASLERARAAELPVFVAEGESYLGYIYMDSTPPRIEAGMAHLRAAIDQLVVLDDKIGQNNAYDLLGNALHILGDHRGAREVFQHVDRLCDACALEEAGVFAKLNLALTAFELGEAAEAGRLAAACNEAATRILNKFAASGALGIEGGALAAVGDLGGGLARLDEATAIAREIGNRYIEAVVLPIQLEAMIAGGQLADARSACDALASLITETRNFEPAAPQAACDAVLRALAGELELAAAAADQAVALAEQAGRRAQLVQALEARARVALAASKVAEARQAAETGLAIADELGVRGRVVALTLLLGEAALAEGTDATGHFTRAAREAGELGRPLLEAQARFGLAAAAPLAQSSRTLADQAREAFETAAATLEPAARARFVGGAAARRIASGDFAAWARALRVAGPVASEQMPLGMRPGMAPAAPGWMNM